jgi:hypothetical protein
MFAGMARRRAALARRLVSARTSGQRGDLRCYADTTALLLLLTRTMGLSRALSYASAPARPESKIVLDHVALQLNEAESLGGLAAPSAEDLVRAAEVADLVAYMRLTTTVIAILEEQLGAALALLGRIAEPSSARQGDQGEDLGLPE